MAHNTRAYGARGWGNKHLAQSRSCSRRSCSTSCVVGGGGINDLAACKLRRVYFCVRRKSAGMCGGRVHQCCCVNINDGGGDGGAQSEESSGVPSQESEEETSEETLEFAMSNARKNSLEGLSPGAGLMTAEEQAEAAFADLINTSLDGADRNALTGAEITELSEGGRMDEGSKARKSGGLLADVVGLFEALSKGAHIVKQKDGRV
eukprot:CAMPEP_0198710686 /NCGR_PEP_ID=MMETSP1471-20131121/2932_1 /TAXON_ID=41880 /ORGANISM="Pycnococcus provasolii, Strain RCC733" /LENGTH=205 /DNA_ID=CAMNT_0044470369 /DNA_START=69 /DNA_END=686 /DNA_ORIENTATION=-